MTSLVNSVSKNLENYQSKQSSFINESSQGADKFRSSNTPARQVVNVVRKVKKIRHNYKKQRGIAFCHKQKHNCQKSKTPKQLEKPLLRSNYLVRLEQSQKVQGSTKEGNKPMKQVSIEAKQQKDTPINGHIAQKHVRMRTQKVTSSNQRNLISKTKINNTKDCHSRYVIPDQYIQEDGKANLLIKEFNNNKQEIRNGPKNQSQLTKVLLKIVDSNEDLKVEIKQLKSKFSQNNQLSQLKNQVLDEIRQTKYQFNQNQQSLKTLLNNSSHSLNQFKTSFSTQVFGYLNNFKQAYAQSFRSFLTEVKTPITNQISDLNIKLDRLITSKDQNSREKQLLFENKIKEIQQFNRSQIQQIKSYQQQISLMKISLQSIQRITKNQQELIKENGQNQRKSSQKMKIMLTNAINANFIKADQTNHKFLFLNKCLSKSMNQMSKNYKRQMSKLHTVFQQNQKIYESLFTFIDSQHPETTERTLSAISSEMQKIQKETQRLLLQNKLSTQKSIKENNNNNNLIFAKQCVAQQDLIKSLQIKTNETNTYFENCLWAMETRIFNNFMTQTNVISQSAQQILLETKSVLQIKTKDLSDQIRGLSLSFNLFADSNERFLQKNSTYLINLWESFQKYENKVSKKIAFLGKGLIESQNRLKSLSRKSENWTKNIISAIHHLKRHMKSHINQSKEHFVSRAIEKILLSNELLLKTQFQKNHQCVKSLMNQFMKIKQEGFMISQIYEGPQQQDNKSDSSLNELTYQIKQSQKSYYLSVSDQSQMEQIQWSNQCIKTYYNGPNYQIIKKTQDTRPILEGCNIILEALDDSNKEKDLVKPNDSIQSNREEFDQSFQNSEIMEINEQKSYYNSRIDTNKKASRKNTYKSEDYSLRESQHAQLKIQMQAIIQSKKSFTYIQQLLSQDRRRQKDIQRLKSVDLDSSIIQKLKRDTQNNEQVYDESQYIESQQIIGVIAQYHQTVDGQFAKLIEKYPKKVNKIYLFRSSINP